MNKLERDLALNQIEPVLMQLVSKIETKEDFEAIIKDDKLLLQKLNESSEDLANKFTVIANNQDAIKDISNHIYRGFQKRNIIKAEV